MKPDSLDAKENINELAYILALETDKDRIKSFLRSIWTPAEIANGAALWALVKAPHKKTPL